MSGPSPFTILRLAATGGRSDGLRIALTAVGSAIAAVLLLAAAAVVFISPEDGPYRLEVLEQRGLHQGVVIALVLLAVPVCLFVGLCSRLGAPARDRRLAAMRMTGATPREVVRVVATETGLATTIGAIVGTAVFLVLKSTLKTAAVGTFTVEEKTLVEDGGAEYLEVTLREVVESRLLLPTDVSIPLWAIVLVPTLLILGTTLASLIALRKVAISPFGVTRSMPAKPPRLLPAALFVGGTIGLIVLGVAVRNGNETSDFVFGVLALVLFLAMAVGLIVGSAAIASTTGRLLVSRVRSPALLIAGRRMIAAPYTASRATTAVLLAALIGGMTQSMRSVFLIGADPSTAEFYQTAFNLVEGVLALAIIVAAASLLVTTAEAIVSRRRTLASLVAGGVPRSVLRRATLAETLIPLTPTVLLAIAGGAAAVRGMTGSSVETFPGVGSDPVMVGVPVPWDRLAAFGGGTVLICACLTGLSLVFMRQATDIAETRAAA